MEKTRFFKFCDIFSEDDIVLPDIIYSIMLEAFPNGSKFARILWLKLMNELYYCLSQFQPMFHLMFSGGIKVEHCLKMG